MKLIEAYKKYKEKYPKYVIIIRCGSFSEVYGEEVYILNNIFGYKIKNVNGNKRVGFPLTGYDKVISKLNGFKINYVIVDGEVLKKKFNRNKYDDYIENLNIDFRINSIMERLKLLRESSKIKIILERIESII